MRYPPEKNSGQHLLTTGNNSVYERYELWTARTASFPYTVYDLSVHKFPLQMLQQFNRYALNKKNWQRGINQ